MGTLSRLCLIQGTQPMELSLAVILWPSSGSTSALKKVCPTAAGTGGRHLAGGPCSAGRVCAIPSFSPVPQRTGLLRWSDPDVVVNAAVLGMLGCIDALLTSVVADSLTRTGTFQQGDRPGPGQRAGLFGPGAGATWAPWSIFRPVAARHSPV